MLSIPRNFLKINDDLFLLVKVYEEERVLNVDLVKDWLNATNVFRKDGKLYFCLRVDEAESVPEDELITEKIETNE